jgi:NADPH-dependent curcumin reductase CurA
MFGWQGYAVVDAEAIERKVGGSGSPISTSLGVLGLNGLTAYFALLDIGRPKAGETVVVSTAAGAVGSCVGQIAKIKACPAVGIAGGPDKARMCREDFGYDAAVDYKVDDFESGLDAACPEGVDVYFDNAAGSISDSVMRRLNVGARAVICGTASIASSDPPAQGHGSSVIFWSTRAMQGFLIVDYAQRFPEALRELESWIRNGQIRYREDILDGIEQAPGSIAGLYRGENLGKRLIRIAPDIPAETSLPYAPRGRTPRQRPPTSTAARRAKGHSGPSPARCRLRAKAEANRGAPPMHGMQGSGDRRTAGTLDRPHFRALGSTKSRRRYEA